MTIAELVHAVARDNPTLSVTVQDSTVYEAHGKALPVVSRSVTCTVFKSGADNSNEDIVFKMSGNQVVEIDYGKTTRAFQALPLYKAFEMLTVRAA